MNAGLTVCPKSYSVISAPHTPSVTRQRCFSVIPPTSRDNPSHENPLFRSTLRPVSSGLLKFSRTDLRCKSTGDSGENESRTVLDAFFLGKALGEALTERIQSNVGELLSIIDRFQAEQQKQILEFQEEVLEKARLAKEQASKEAMEAQGRTSKSISSDISRSDGVSEVKSAEPKITKEDPLMRLLNQD